MVTRVIGDFCWVELYTSDFPAAFQFYQSLFAWGKNSHSSEGCEGDYHMLTVGDKEIAGGFEITNDMREKGAVPCWNSYVLVQNVDQIVEKAQQLHGKVVAGPFDIDDHGRMAILQDPTGAVFSIWEAKKTAGDCLDKMHPGNFGWNELLTNDVEKAQAFYTQLFGWKAENKAFEGSHPYTNFMVKDVPVGGMMKIPEECQGMPAHWNVYFTVADIDKTVKVAQAKGAEICYDIMEIAEVGRFTTLKDPQGVCFSLIQFSA